jgi:hypothetical protein
MSDSPGVKYIDSLRIGFDELAWLQSFNDDEVKAARLAGSRTTGLVCDVEPGGRLGGRWALEDDGSGTVAFLGETVPQMLVDEDGSAAVWDPAEFESNLPAVPDDAVWYTLVCRIKLSEYARGTIDFTTGSAALAGTDTRLTRHSGATSGGDNGGLGTKIRVEAADSANGNDGDYQLDTITDDTNATMTSNALGTTETGVPYKVIGSFFAATPSAAEIHLRPVVEFELVTRTRTPAAGDLVLADVMYDTGSSADVQIIDRRLQNVWRPMVPSEGQQGLMLAHRFRLQTKASGASWTIQPDIDELYTTGAGTMGQSAAALNQDGAHALVWDRGGTIYSAEVNRNRGQLTAPASFGGGTAPCVVRSPRRDATSGELEMLMFYVSANAIWMSISTDSGATWGAGAKKFDPTNVDALDTANDPCAVFLPNGRLVVACSYFDNSAGTNTIVSFYSDDYGDNFVVNGDAGYALVTTDGNVDPALWVAPGGNLLVLVCEGAFNGLSIFWGLGSDADGITALGSATGLTILGGLSYADFGIATDVHLDPSIIGDAQGNLAIVAGAKETLSNDSWLTVFHVSITETRDTDGSLVGRLDYGLAEDLVEIDSGGNSMEALPVVLLNVDGTVTIYSAWDDTNAGTTTTLAAARMSAVKTAAPVLADLDHNYS